MSLTFTSSVSLCVSVLVIKAVSVCNHTLCPCAARIVSSGHLIECEQLALQLFAGFLGRYFCYRLLHLLFVPPMYWCFNDGHVNLLAVLAVSPQLARGRLAHLAVSAFSQLCSTTGLRFLSLSESDRFQVLVFATYLLPSKL